MIKSRNRPEILHVFFSPRTNHPTIRSDHYGICKLTDKNQDINLCIPFYAIKNTPVKKFVIAFSAK